MFFLQDAINDSKRWSIKMWTRLWLCEEESRNVIRRNCAIVIWYSKSQNLFLSGVVKVGLYFDIPSLLWKKCITSKCSLEIQPPNQYSLTCNWGLNYSLLKGLNTLCTLSIILFIAFTLNYWKYKMHHVVYNR